MAEDLVVGFTTIESLKRCFSQVGKQLMFVTFVSLNFFLTTLFVLYFPNMPVSFTE